jgi:hypothetical protein
LMLLALGKSAHGAVSSTPLYRLVNSLVLLHVGLPQVTKLAESRTAMLVLMRAKAEKVVRAVEKCMLKSKTERS